MLNLILLWAFVEKLMPAMGVAEASSGGYLLLAQAAAIILVSFFNFAMNSVWTFGADVRGRNDAKWT